MKLTPDDARREFIAFMEQQHGQYAYPRNFFGVLTSLLLEANGITQDRIMELTGYSRAGVSAALQKIQFLMPIIMTKKAGDRRNYYEYDGSLVGFLVDLMAKRTDTPDINPSLLEEVRLKSATLIDKHPAFIGLCQHTGELRRAVVFMSELRARAEFPLILALKKGTVEDIQFPDVGDLWASMPSWDCKPLGAKTTGNDEDYQAVKRQFFDAMRRSLNPLFSQSAANTLIVVHDVMIEGDTTQERIERSTRLPRSTISEILKSAVSRGLIRVETQPGTRVKRYSSEVSVSELVIVHYRRASIYATSVRISWMR